MLKKLIFLFFLLVLFGVAAYIFHSPILNSVATFLIVEDSLQKADAMFVLSGSGYVRGNEAAKIFRKGFVPKIVCTGGNPEIEFMAFGIDTLESDLTVANIRRLGVPDSAIVEIREDTSTREEAAIILSYCQQNNLKQIIVLSSLIHTRRINSVFRKKFEEAGIKLIVRGAHMEDAPKIPWWQDEESMIEVNNEWMKTFCYWWKY